MTLRLLLCLVYSALVVLVILREPARASANTPALRRFALVVGSNNGGNDRVRLRYAGRDANNIATVLRQLGGVNNADMTRLDEPSMQDIDRAFDALSNRVRDERKKGQRIELVVYYSGHADENGILVGGTRYDYARLRQRIRAVPADVHIAIVDSCASGSFTRLKGGTKLPPFLRDSSNQVQGFAFLSSSSADEDAQESDRIGASFFTYFFVAGLRGAADRNRDGKITLTEAYQYAYEQTLGRTQNTRHGPQHPAYDMHLSGTGDIIMSDLRSTESALVFPVALKGRITLVDKTTRRVVVEVTKEAGEPLSLALPNETYSVHVENSQGEFIATVTLDHVGEISFDQDALRRAKPEETIARGAYPRDDDDDDDDDDDPDFFKRSIGAGFGGGLRVERPNTRTDFDAIVTLGGTMREVSGKPVVGVATVGELSLGATVGDNTHFVYDMHLGFGPGVFIGSNLQVGASIGFGFSGITGGVLDFAWKVPTEAFAVLHLSRDIRPVAYVRQTYLWSSEARQNGSKSAKWGDEAEAGAGVRFGGKLDGFMFGSVREMAGERYWGIGIGAVL